MGVDNPGQPAASSILLSQEAEREPLGSDRLFWSPSNLFDLLEGRVCKLGTWAVPVGRNRSGASVFNRSARSRAEPYYQREFRNRSVRSQRNGDKLERERAGR